MSGRKSRDKGARGEREAAAFLQSLGFEASRNGRNGYSTDDLIVPGLPNIHFEVKYGYPLESMDIHTKSLRDAWEQALHGICIFCSVQIGCVLHRDDDHSHMLERSPVVLWKPPRRQWRLTWMEPCGLVTCSGPDTIKTKLLELNGT